jgi:hypothetical protein
LVVEISILKMISSTSEDVDCMQILCAILHKGLENMHVLVYLGVLETILMDNERMTVH